MIVVDDGSTDATATIAREYPFRVISTRNRGLSSARNTGLCAARGEIVAYIDDDAWPDPQWLTYLAMTFVGTNHAGVGGPNIPPPGDGWVAECVAHAPGGPVHVLIGDREAEHIPGCNMAFRRECLTLVGGFDPQFRAAGDDVDLCWRLQAGGFTIGFHPGAMVWHHRRNSVRAYLRQQRGYGRAEALLERKWPGKYNAAGHVSWAGRLYGGLASAPSASRAHLSRQVGERAVPVGLSAGARGPGVAPRDARMVPGDPLARRPREPRRPVEATRAGRARGSRCRRRAVARARGPERPGRHAPGGGTIASRALPIARRRGNPSSPKRPDSRSASRPGSDSSRSQRWRRRARRVEAINADYERHCRAARAIAAECFSSDRVLGALMREAGV